MESLNAQLLIIVAGWAAGFVNAIAGGGTLLSFPALLYGGMGAVAANATSTVAIWPGTLASVWAYRAQLTTKRREAVTLAVPSLIGGLAGSIILLSTPERAFRVIVPYLILFACGLLVVQEQVARWVARRSREQPHAATAALWIVQLLIGVYGGYFGAGIGIMMLAAMAIFMPEDLQSANALKVFFALLINGIAAVYFVVIGAAHIAVAIPMALAALAGGWIGARTAQRLSPGWLRAVVVAFGVIVALHLLMTT